MCVCVRAPEKLPPLGGAMAEAAGSREPAPAGRAAPSAEEEPEPAALDAPGRRRERRSGVSAVGAAERLAGSSLGAPAAPDPDACLLEAAKATPRRSSIIKVRAGCSARELPAGPAAAGLPGLEPFAGAGRLEMLRGGSPPGSGR